MLVGIESFGNWADKRFALPPWSVESEDWLRIDERLPLSHLARQIDRAVDGLDLQPLFDSYTGVGKKAHRPDLMLKIVLYEIHSKRQSPAQWSKDVRESEPVRWLGLGIEPSRTRLYEFRDRIGPYLDDWNAQVLQLAVEQQVTSGKRVSLDGSSVAANASRKKLYNEKQIAERIAEIEAVLLSCSDGRPFPETPGWMANNPWSLVEQHQRYQFAAQVMEQRQQVNQQRRSSKRKPREKVLVSLTDPEAALAPDKHKVFRPLYNVQLVRDLDSPLVLAYETFAQGNDAGTVSVMLEKTTELVGLKPEEMLADSGYASVRDLEICNTTGVLLYAPWQENQYSEKRGKRSGSNQFVKIPKTDFSWLEEEQTFRCPEGHLLQFTKNKKEKRFDHEVTLRLYTCPPEHCSCCPRKEQCTTNPDKGRTVSRMDNEELLDELRFRMLTEEAKALYKLRAQTVELSYADMKEHRGLRRFSGRGLARAKIQVASTVLVHNLLTVLRAIEQNTAVHQKAAA